MSDVINEKIQLWRAKAADGTLSLDEMREAIAAIRKERVNSNAQEKSTKSRAKKAETKANEVIDSDDLLKDLGI